MTTKWTEPLVYDMLESIVEMGLSYSQTARYLNRLHRTKLSRSAISGKVAHLRRDFRGNKGVYKHSSAKC